MNYSDPYTKLQAAISELKTQAELQCPVRLADALAEYRIKNLQQRLQATEEHLAKIVQLNLDLTAKINSIEAVISPAQALIDANRHFNCLPLPERHSSRHEMSHLATLIYLISNLDAALHNVSCKPTS